MAKIKFHFNPETLSYEQIEHSIAHWLKQVAIHAVSGLSLGIIFFFIFVSTIQSPEEKELIQEKAHMEAQYKVLEKQFHEVQYVMTDLQERDDNLYRVVFQADPIPLSVRRGSSANTEYYEQLLDMTNSEIVVSTSKKLNELKKELYIQSKSYDELILLAKNKKPCSKIFRLFNRYSIRILNTWPRDMAGALTQSIIPAGFMPEWTLQLL